MKKIKEVLTIAAAFIIGISLFIFLRLIYILCRLMMVVVINKGMPAFEYWMADQDVKKHIDENGNTIPAFVSIRTRQISALFICVMFGLIALWSVIFSSGLFILCFAIYRIWAYKYAQNIRKIYFEERKD